MAVVALANIYNPLVFAGRIQEAQTEKNAFLSSGIAIADAEMARQFAQGGNIAEFPFFAPIGTGEPNYSSDDPASKSTPANIASKKNIARMAMRNKSWSTMDLARELALQDPIGAITGRIGEYWATDDQTRIIKSCLGVLADNVANDSGDMLKSVASDSADAITDAERISGSVIIDAKQTLGDARSMVSVLAIHSAIYTRLEKQNLITFIPASEGRVGFMTYQGLRLIVDDALPAVAGTNRITYTSIMFGPGAFLTAPGNVLNPSAMKRDEDAGNGGGQDTIFSRVANVFHPNGFQFTSASVAGKSATYAELATAANWDRVMARKNIPMAFVKTND